MATRFEELKTQLVQGDLTVGDGNGITQKLALAGKIRMRKGIVEDKKTREFLLALAQELTKKSGDGLQERDTVTVMVGKNKYTVASPVMEKDKLMLSAADFDALLQRFFPDTAGQEVLPVAEWKKQVDKIIGLAGRNNPLNSVPLSKGIYFQDTITSAILYAKVIQPDGSYFVFGEPEHTGRVIYKCDSAGNPIGMLKIEKNGKIIDKKGVDMAGTPYAPAYPLARSN